MWRNLLPPEVVDGEQAAVRLHVRWRLVIAESGVVGEVQVFVAQFAADEDERAADTQPAAVDGGVGVGLLVPFDGDVHKVVVEADDVAADVDRDRQQGDTLDGFAAEFEDRGLAVAGRAPEHRGPARRQRQADLRDDIAGEHELLEGAGQANWVGRADFRVLLQDAEVILDGHRYRPHVLAAVESKSPLRAYPVR